MGLTLRQLQRMLSASVKNPDALLGSGTNELRTLARVWGGAGFNNAAVKNGCVVNACTCQNCRQNPADPVSNVQSFVDSLCRQYGPNTPVAAALDDLLKNQQQRQGNGQSGDNGDESDEKSSDNEQSGDSSSSAQARQSDPRAEAKARDAADAWQEEEARRQRMEERARQEAAAEKARKAAEAKAAAAALAEAKKALKNAKAGRGSTWTASRALKNARRAVSTATATFAGRPSLEARRQLAAANGRLRRVPTKLRARMAELINRLVGSSGASGGAVSPIPVYDSRKLVKRMLVRRPLPNALKEDVITGRPVTLFLPDVSPSCAAQAQDACDIANAAGFAGVSGSDVLVLPHSNGCVSEYEEAYVPWFNGKPVDLRQAEWERLFTQIVAGRSKYKIRVVVAVGDHDAADMYQQLVALKTVRRLVWLHNETVNGVRTPNIERDMGSFLSWSPELTQKTTLVWSCSQQQHMIRGLDLALKNR